MSSGDDTLRIEWPLGVVQELYNLAPKQSLTIIEPAVTVPWRKRTVLQGMAVNFVVNSQVTNALSFQWQLNGTNLLGQTNQTLELPSASLADVGQYRLAIQTATGLVLSPVAHLVILSQPPQLAVLPLTNGLLTLEVNGGISPGLMIQASTNLLDWVSIATKSATNAPFLFRDTKASLFRSPFYRTITP